MIYWARELNARTCPRWPSRRRIPRRSEGRYRDGSHNGVRPPHPGRERTSARRHACLAQDYISATAPSHVESTNLRGARSRGARESTTSLTDAPNPRARRRPEYLSEQPCSDNAQPWTHLGNNGAICETLGDLQRDGHRARHPAGALALRAIGQRDMYLLSWLGCVVRST